MLTNATIPQLREALNLTNEKFYGGNLTFNRLEQQGRRVRFTLRVHSRHGQGARLSHPHPSWTTRAGNPYKQRHLVSACWHAHGNFFDCLFEIAPDVWVLSRNTKITAKENNWQDFDVGSMMNPAMLSELCECGNWEEIQAEKRAEVARKQAKVARKQAKALAKVKHISIYF